MSNLSKSDARELASIQNYLNNGMVDTAQRLLNSFLRSAPSDKIHAKRLAAVKASGIAG
jgi:hypothetical protein